MYDEFGSGYMAKIEMSTRLSTVACGLTNPLPADVARASAGGTTTNRVAPLRRFEGSPKDPLRIFVPFRAQGAREG